jgi:hypothetical protein
MVLLHNLQMVSLILYFDYPMHPKAHPSTARLCLFGFGPLALIFPIFGI